MQLNATLGNLDETLRGCGALFADQSILPTNDNLDKTVGNLDKTVSNLNKTAGNHEFNATKGVVNLDNASATLDKINATIGNLDKTSGNPDVSVEESPERGCQMNETMSGKILMDINDVSI